MNTIQIANINKTMEHVNGQWLPIVIAMAEYPEYDSNIGIMMIHYWYAGNDWDDEKQAMELIEDQWINITNAWDSYYIPFHDEVGISHVCEMLVKKMK